MCGGGGEVLTVCTVGLLSEPVIGRAREEPRVL